MSLSPCIFEVLHANPTWRNPRPISTSSVWFYLGQLAIMSPIKSMDAVSNFLWQKPWDLFARMHCETLKSIFGSSASSRFTMEAAIFLQKQSQAMPDKFKISHCVEETLPPAKLATPQKALWPISSGNGLWGSPGMWREQERTCASSGRGDNNATCNACQTSGILLQFSCFAFWVHESYCCRYPCCIISLRFFSQGFIGQQNPPAFTSHSCTLRSNGVNPRCLQCFFPQGILKGGTSCAQITLKC